MKLMAIVVIAGLFTFVPASAHATTHGCTDVWPDTCQPVPLTPVKHAPIKNPR